MGRYLFVVMAPNLPEEKIKEVNKEEVDETEEVEEVENNQGKMQLKYEIEMDIPKSVGEISRFEEIVVDSEETESDSSFLIYDDINEKFDQLEKSFESKSKSTVGLNYKKEELVDSKKNTISVPDGNIQTDDNSIKMSIFAIFLGAYVALLYSASEILSFI